VDIHAPLKFRVAETRDPPGKDRFGDSLMSAFIANISAEGLCFISNAPLKPEDVLSLSFSLSEVPITDVRAKLLRVDPHQGKEDKVFKHHMQYVDIDPVQKEKIIKYVFEKIRQKKEQAKDLQ
jgi:c-di-GMP-binding flagellar brake protein YcgR